MPGLVKRRRRAARLARRMPGRPRGAWRLAGAGAAGRALERDGLALPMARAGARGVVAAMAMSGMRRATTGLGLVKEEPPDAALERTAGGLLARIPAPRRQAVVELAHWSYGAAGGAAFGLLPRPVRAHRVAGPVYGVLSWLLFELGLAPLLGLGHAKRSSVAERAALAADHMLYGTVVAASPFAKRS